MKNKNIRLSIKAFIGFLIIICTIFGGYYATLHFHPNVAYFENNGCLVYNESRYIRVEWDEQFQILHQLGEVKPCGTDAFFSNMMLYSVSVNDKETEEYIAVCRSRTNMVIYKKYYN